MDYIFTRKSIIPLFQAGFVLPFFLLIGTIFLLISVDFVFAYFSNYSFYWSESLLFSSSWILFIPVAYFLHGIRWTTKYQFLFPFIGAFILVLGHSLVFGVISHIISLIFFGYTFNWSDVAFEFIQDNGISYLIIYFLLIHFFSINKEAPNNNCIDRSPKEVLWLNQGKLIVKIHLNQLKYVKTEKPYLLLNTVEKNYLYHQSLKNLLAELPQSCFIQIHRSTILNIKFIQEIRNKKNGDFEVVLTDLRVLKGSRRFRSELQEVLSTRLD